MCDFCNALGLTFSDCENCGEEFIWKRWDSKELGSPAAGISAGTPEAELAMESPCWTGTRSPSQCVVCSPDGYVHPPVDAESLAWMRGRAASRAGEPRRRDAPAARARTHRARRR